MAGWDKVGGKTGPRWCSLALLLSMLTALADCPSAAAVEPASPKLVVVFYPHESDGAPGIILVNRAIRATFAGQPPGSIEIRNEYVDATRLRDAEFMQAQVSLLKRKYAGRKVDLVIAGLSAGLDFALAIRGEVFPSVPIVFTLVDEREVKAQRARWVRAEEGLRGSREDLQILTGQAQETERRRIARELHDDLNLRTACAWCREEISWYARWSC